MLEFQWMHSKKNHILKFTFIIKTGTKNQALSKDYETLPNTFGILQQNLDI